MQLFVLDKTPNFAANALCDCHVRKMCLETAQILSSVMTRLGIPLTEGMPKPYNLKHPVIKAIDTQEKINWVLAYNYFLHNVFEFRFGKPHKYKALCEAYNVLFERAITNKMSYNLAVCFKDFSTDESDIIEAHRAYYRYKKSLFVNKNIWKYTKSDEPEWLK